MNSNSKIWICDACTFKNSDAMMKCEMCETPKVQTRQRTPLSAHCRVAGCGENHSTHYCGECRATDSDHFKRNCPSRAAGNLIPENLPPPPPVQVARAEICPICSSRFSNVIELIAHSKKNHYTNDAMTDFQGSVKMTAAPAPNLGPFAAATQGQNASNLLASSTSHSGCTQDHQAHFCKLCQDKDADHHSSECTKITRAQSFFVKSCLVQGCHETHTRHYCRVCGNRNSDHFSRQCPNNVVATSPLNAGCHVPGCTEKHAAHYCQYCNHQDSDHFEKDCPANPTVPSSNSCKVPGCALNHPQHYCKVCGNTDADHHSSQCTSKPLAAVKTTGCRVTGCTEQHSAHFCQFCNNHDSDHFKDACPTKPIAPSNLRCKVQGCSEQHAAHFCQFCNNQDSDHFKNACPVKPTASSNLRCKVQGCTDTHAAHYCKFCQNNDSDHFKNDCPSKPTADSNVRCKVTGCSDTHAAHYCWVCKNKDSDHLSATCGSRNQAVLYHASLKKNESSILQSGLRKSRQGTLGPGVYFVTSLKHAEEIARFAPCRGGLARSGANESFIVVEAHCDLGNVCSAPDDARWAHAAWQASYDSCYHKHGAWAFVKKDFREVCIKDESRVKVVRIHDCI